jgi:hypothetical protein
VAYSSELPLAYGVHDQAGMREVRNSFTFLVRNPKGKRKFGRPRRSLENVIKIDLEIGWEEWTEIVWLRTRASGGIL